MSASGGIQPPWVSFVSNHVKEIEEDDGDDRNSEQPQKDSAHV